jgi:hypothetical protein
MADLAIGYEPPIRRDKRVEKIDALINLKTHKMRQVSKKEANGHQKLVDVLGRWQAGAINTDMLKGDELAIEIEDYK